MKHDLLTEIDDFIAETGLSEYRAGIVLAKNGRLVPRLRSSGRVWPETEVRVRAALAAERSRRSQRSPREDAA